MMNDRQRLHAAGALALVLAIGGCSTFDGRDDTGDGADPDLIAQNLIFSLTQLPGMNPLTTTVQVAPPNSAFGKEVVRLIGEAGYGMQEVEGDIGARFVRYRDERIHSEMGAQNSYTIAIGDVSVSRSFKLDDSRTVPASAQLVTGVPEQDIALNDDLFGAVPEKVSYTMFDMQNKPQIRTVGPGGQEVVPASGAVTSATELIQAIPNQASFGSRVKQNLYTLIASNYSDLFGGYGNVRQEILEFGNDSMKLGDKNKNIIDEIAGQFDPATDLVSIIGCSHGDTKIANGNAVLATGRANRVKEAFLFAGVDSTKVLEEGCWAGTYHDVFPTRGVVLSLKRRTG